MAERPPAAAAICAPVGILPISPRARFSRIRMNAGAYRKYRKENWLRRDICCAILLKTKGNHVMVATIQDVINANLVLVEFQLLRTSQDIEEFKNAVGSDVEVAGMGLFANIPTGRAEPGYALNLRKDRIALELSPPRSTIGMEYPTREGLARLANVACLAIASTSSELDAPQAFGFNVEVVFNQDSGNPASRYLSDRLFSSKQLGSEDWELVGGSGKFIFNDGGTRWTFDVEPRFNVENESRVFLRVNLHKSENRVPDKEEIQGSLEKAWDEIHNFMDRLDRSGQ